VQFDRETDGRWIAEVVELSGVMVYGTSRDQALARVQALALHTLADRIEHGEADPQSLLSVSFATSCGWLSESAAKRRERVGDIQRRSR
jgi:predicted RNase H-like HicB family nuclease